MEKLPHQEYRDELAEKLKDIRNSDPENPEVAKAKAEGYLEAKKETVEYQKAENIHGKEMRIHRGENLIDFENRENNEKEIESIINKLELKQQEGTHFKSYYITRNAYDFKNEIIHLKEVFSLLLNRESELVDLGFKINIEDNIEWNKLPDSIRETFRSVSYDGRIQESTGYYISPTPMGNVTFYVSKNDEKIPVISQEIILKGKEKKSENMPDFKRIEKNLNRKVDEIIEGLLNNKQK